MLTNAIQSKDKNDWRHYRNNKNILDKEIKTLKTNYISNKMKDTKNNWKFLKQYNKCKKTRPPDRLNCNSRMVTNP